MQTNTYLGVLDLLIKVRHYDALEINIYFSNQCKTQINILCTDELTFVYWRLMKKYVYYMFATAESFDKILVS